MDVSFLNRVLVDLRKRALGLTERLAMITGLPILDVV